MVRCLPVLVLAACATGSAEPEPAGWAHQPPIEGADPSKRHAETVRLPAGVRVERRTDGAGSCLVFGIDGNRMEEATLDVGHLMIVGYRVEWTVRHGDGERVWIGEDLGNDMGNAETSWYGEQGGIPPGALTLEAAVELFETDVPPQHMWEPREGLYRVLWSRTLSARVP